MRARRPGAGRAWVIHPDDNVATVVSACVEPGSLLRLGGAAAGRTIRARAAIPHGHKVALRSLARGAILIKYGLPIGRATRPIRAGDHLHVHNVESRRGRGDLASRARRRR
jgi:altronate dehydratase small subunit